MDTFLINREYRRSEDMEEVCYVLRDPEDVVLEGDEWTPVVEPLAGPYELKKGEIGIVHLTRRNRLEIVAWSPATQSFQQSGTQNVRSQWARAKRMLNKKVDHISTKALAESLMEPDQVAEMLKAARRYAREEKRAKVNRPEDGPGTCLPLA